MERHRSKTCRALGQSNYNWKSFTNLEVGQTGAIVNAAAVEEKVNDAGVDRNAEHNGAEVGKLMSTITHHIVIIIIIIKLLYA